MSAISVSTLDGGATHALEARKVIRSGLIAGAALALVVAVGMFLAFDRRKIIDPFLSAGYLVIMWVPILFGYRVSVRPALEGFEGPKPGRSNVVAGAIVGAIAGAMLGLLIIITDTFNIRDAFIHLSPTLVETLSFGGSLYTGTLILIVGGAVLAAFGGALHTFNTRTKEILATLALTILAFSFLELVIGDILRSAGLRPIDNWIYAPSRGLKPMPAVLFCAIAVAARIFFQGRSLRVNERYRAMDTKGQQKWGLVAGVVAIALGAFLPAIFGTFLNDVLSNVGLFILLGLGLNIVVGYAGLLDLGYVAFFAVGAYTAAVVTSPRSPQFTPEMAFFEALPWVLLMAVIAGLFIGTPVIRMRGDYLAIVTLGFGEIIRIALNSEWLTPLFGGAQGIVRIAPIDPGGAVSGIRVDFGYVLAVAGVIALIVGYMRWRDTRAVAREQVEPIPGVVYEARTTSLLLVGGMLAIGLGLAFPTFATWTIIGINPANMFRIVLVFVAVAIFVSWRLRDSRVGRAWMAIREDEQIAQSMGINIVTNKLLAFVMGAMMASLGGAFFAVKLGTIFPHSFEIIQSIIILVVVIVGGMGSIKGVIIGAVVLIGILGGPTQVGLLREMAEFKLLAYGVILIWMMLNRPEGLWPETRRARELHQEEMGQDAWLKSGSTTEGETS